MTQSASVKKSDTAHTHTHTLTLTSAVSETGKTEWWSKKAKLNIFYGRRYSTIYCNYCGKAICFILCSPGCLPIEIEACHSCLTGGVSLWTPLSSPSPRKCLLVDFIDLRTAVHTDPSLVTQKTADRTRPTFHSSTRLADSALSSKRPERPVFNGVFVTSREMRALDAGTCSVGGGGCPLWLN